MQNWYAFLTYKKWVKTELDKVPFSKVGASEISEFSKV